jgi:uridine kinase
MITMSLVIGIGGMTGSGKSTCAKIFANKLEKAGYKVGWPTKYVTRKRRSNEDTNTICVDREDDIPASFTRWDINGKTVAYDIQEIRNMIDDDIFPIVLSSSLDLLFDIKRSVKSKNPILLKDTIDEEVKAFLLSNQTDLENMRIIYTVSYYLDKDNLKELTMSRGIANEEDLEREVEKRYNERDYYMGQFLKYYSYVSRGTHTLITKLPNMQNFNMTYLEEMVDRHLNGIYDNNISILDHNKINRFFLRESKNASVIDPKWLFDNIDNFAALNNIRLQEKVEVKKKENPNIGRK